MPTARHVHQPLAVGAEMRSHQRVQLDARLRRECRAITLTAAHALDGDSRVAFFPQRLRRSAGQRPSKDALDLRRGLRLLPQPLSAPMIRAFPLLGLQLPLAVPL